MNPHSLAEFRRFVVGCGFDLPTGLRIQGRQIVCDLDCVWGPESCGIAPQVRGDNVCLLFTAEGR